jgi:hypothetical protein
MCYDGALRPVHNAYIDMFRRGPVYVAPLFSRAEGYGGVAPATVVTQDEPSDAV